MKTVLNKIEKLLIEKLNIKDCPVSVSYDINNYSAPEYTIVIQDNHCFGISSVFSSEIGFDECFDQIKKHIKKYTDELREKVWNKKRGGWDYKKYDKYKY